MTTVLKPKPNPDPSSLAEKLAAQGSACPIPLTHDRLHEVHHWWHEMARWYHEPEPFRYRLGAFIQAARTTTFMLQKERSAFDDFSWYEKWAERSKIDPVISWIASARTDLVHRAALAPDSSLEMHCLDNPRNPHGTDENPLVLEINPFQCTHYYITQGPRTDHAHEYVRSWEIDSLPGFELLDACGHVYDRLDDLVTIAHNKANAEIQSHRIPGAKRNLPCMENTNQHRVIRTVVSDGVEDWIDEPPGLHHD